MKKRKIARGPDGWFALLIDQDNARLGGIPLLKTPVVAWSYDPWGEFTPTAYGYVRGPYTELNKKLRDGANEAPVPLVYDILLTPTGEIVDRHGETFESLETWLRTYDSSEEIKINVREAAGIPVGHPDHSDFQENKRCEI